MKLIPIQPSDFNKVLDLFKDAAEKIALKNIDHWQYWKDPPVEKVKWVQEGIQNNEFFFIENSEGNLMGMVRILEKDLLYWGEMNDKARYLHSLVITDEYNGKGIGSKVIQKIEQEAGEKGIDYLRLDCDAKNPKLCAYYENQGFEKVGEKELPISTYNLYEKRIDKGL